MVGGVIRYSYFVENLYSNMYDINIPNFIHKFKHASISQYKYDESKTVLRNCNFAFKMAEPIWPPLRL